MVCVPLRVGPGRGGVLVRHREARHRGRRVL